MGNWRQQKKLTPADRAKKKLKKQARRLASLLHPMSTVRRYADAATVFGETSNPQQLVEVIGTFDWRDAFVALAQLAAGVANDRQGPGREALERWGRDAILRMNGTNRNAIEHAHTWARSGDDAVVVHEEAIDYVEHLILLHAGETGGAPDDRQIVLWLLAAADHIGKWQQESEVTADEHLIAEQVRVSRFNNTENPLALLVRIRETFGKPPFAGELSDAATWAAVQQAAFGRPFFEHFDACVLPLYAKCLSWEFKKDVYPVIDPLHWVRETGEAGQRTAAWLLEQAHTRKQLVEAIQRRMRPGGILPHAPTALLHSPLVRLLDDKVGVASPWRVMTYLRTGIWAAFMRGTKAVLGDNAFQAWTSGFGYMFEEYLRSVAMRAIGDPPGRLVLPTHPGSADEIDDVVVVEDGTAILFSAKARLVEESVSRQAKSERMVMDWYEKYFFANESGDFRAGTARQFDSRITRIRAGEFSGFPRDLHIVPVLVTYDALCEEMLLYEWLDQRCQHHGVLRQDNVAQLAIAHVDDFERLMARAMHGESLAAFFAERVGRWKNRRLQTQLRSASSVDRLPFMINAFKEMVASANKQLAGPKV